LGVAFDKGWQDGKAHGRLNTPDVFSRSHENLVNFDPLTPEFTVIIWQPFRRQMGEIGEAPTLTVVFLDHFPPKVPQRQQPPKVIMSSSGGQNRTTLSPISPQNPNSGGVIWHFQGYVENIKTHIR